MQEEKMMMSDPQVEEAARLFGVLSEPVRLFLLRTLMAGPQTVGELVEVLGLKQANVSKHLGILAGAGFVEGMREGNFVRYRIKDQRLDALCRLMCDRIREDARERAVRLGVG